MSYEINVSENGKHLFATHERSLLTEAAALALAKRLFIAFPHCEVSVTRRETVGYHVCTLGPT